MRKYLLICLIPFFLSCERKNEVVKVELQLDDKMYLRQEIGISIGDTVDPSISVTYRIPDTTFNNSILAISPTMGIDWGDLDLTNNCIYIIHSVDTTKTNWNIKSKTLYVKEEKILLDKDTTFNFNLQLKKGSFNNAHFIYKLQ